jgi:tRNA U54 and U55 pseudouridine synthase Pus10
VLRWNSKKQTSDIIKILLLNIAYCTELNGSLCSYLFHGHRHVWRPKKVEQRVLKKLGKILQRENPDLVLLCETRQGTTLPSYSHCDTENKYGPKSLLRKLPIFKTSCNGFFAKYQIQHDKRFLKQGPKKLVYELTLPNNIQLLFGHFSTQKIIRKKQFKELQDMTSEQCIICGDLNIQSFDELADLMQSKNLHLAHQEKTFPACKPTKPFDAILCSENLVTNTRVLDDQLSDHRAVIFEVIL